MRFSRTTLALFAALLCMEAALLAGLRFTYERRIDIAEDLARNVNGMLASQVGNHVAQADRVLQELARRMTEPAGPDGAELARQAMTYRTALPDITAIALTDGGGRVLYQTHEKNPGLERLAGDYCLAQQQGDGTDRRGHALLPQGRPVGGLPLPSRQESGRRPDRRGRGRCGAAPGHPAGLEQAHPGSGHPGLHLQREASIADPTAHAG